MTTGPTSELDTSPVLHHTAELVERHAIMHPLLGVRQPDHRDYPEQIAAAKVQALDWAAAHGLELGGLGVTVRSGGHERGPAVGVTFTVTVGKGGISPDQSVPGVLDSWRWSGPRVEWWRVIFDRIAKARGGRLVARQADELTNIRPLRRPGRL